MRSTAFLAALREIADGEDPIGSLLFFENVVLRGSENVAFGGSIIKKYGDE
jgi:hypothetical protein